MNNPNFEKEVNIINNLKFKHLENIKCGELLATKLFYEKKNISYISALRGLISIFLNSHIYKETQSNSETAFFFTPSYAGRMDHYNDFMAVTSCVSNPLIFNGNKQKTVFSLNRIIGIFYWFLWLVEMKKTGFPLNYCMQLCNLMLQAYYVLEDVKTYKYNKDKLKLVVTFCDVHPCDYLITQYFNKLEINTATLQHAVFFHGTQWYCYQFSHSKYFLATNEYSKSEANKSRHLGEVKVVGSMKAINSIVSNNNEKKNKNTFGLALCGPTFAKQNKALFDYSKYLQDKYGFELRIRLHPVLKIDDYKKSFDLLNNYEISKESVKEFADSCDFVILGATNMFAELITYNTPTFRIISDGIADIYEGIEDFYFNNQEQLDKLIALKDDIEEFQIAMNRVKKYLSPEGDIKELYKYTLEEISNE